MSDPTGYNAISLARGQQQAQRVELFNPPSGGISDWGSDLRIDVWDDVEKAPVLSKTSGFTVVDNAGVFEWLPAAADTSSLTVKAYTYRITRVSTGGPVCFGPFVVLP